MDAIRQKITKETKFSLRAPKVKPSLRFRPCDLPCGEIALCPHGFFEGEKKWRYSMWQSLVVVRPDRVVPHFARSLVFEHSLLNGKHFPAKKFVAIV